MNSVIFISGIDTDIGKTYATGILAKSFIQQGIQTITQKIVQTGLDNTNDIAPDIYTHRKLMGLPLQPLDLDHSTCPYRFIKPCSPHLASHLENRPINPNIITKATAHLQQQYQLVLLEGAGGLLVPLNKELLLLDYIAQQNYPIILVTSGRLGSINHTLLSLKLIKQYGLSLYAIIYNHLHDNDKQISQDTIHYLQQYLKKHHQNSQWLSLPNLTKLSENKRHEFVFDINLSSTN